MQVTRSAKSDKTYFVHLEVVKESVHGARSVNGFIQMEIEGDDAPEEGSFIEFDFATPVGEAHEKGPHGIQGGGSVDQSEGRGLEVQSWGDSSLGGKERLASGQADESSPKSRKGR